MKKLALLATLLAAGVSPVLAAPPQQAPQPPQPKIVVIDRAAILQLSKAGQDIQKQLKTLTDQAGNDLQAQRRSLQAQAQQLQQQVAILAPDVKAKRVADFEAKEQALQGAAQRKQAQIQGGMMQAQQTMSAALGPIVQQIVAERGANLVLDRSAVVFSNNNGFDITMDAINRLNAKLSSVKVSLINPPAAPAAPKK